MPSIRALPTVLPFVGIFAVACVGAPPVTQVAVEDLEFTGVSRLEVHVPSGDVEISAGGRTRVRSVLQWAGDERPNLDARMVGGTLLLDLRCPTALETCTVDHRVTLPADVVVDVYTGAGVIAVDGIDADIAVEATEGDLLLWDLGGDVNADAGTGDIVAAGLEGRVFEAITASGDLDVEILGPVQVVDIGTASGEVELRVPSGAYDLAVWSLDGAVEVSNVVDLPGASASISTFSRSGDVRVVGIEQESDEGGLF